jgi:hypothetical protein
MEAYANDACRTVAAQVSEAVGFQGMTQSTADTLAEVLARYIEEVSDGPPRRPNPCPPASLARREGRWRSTRAARGATRR